MFGLVDCLKVGLACIWLIACWCLQTCLLQEEGVHEYGDVVEKRG